MGALEGGQQVVLVVTWEGTQSAEMVTEQGTIPPSAKRQKTPSAFIFDHDNRDLKEIHHYFETRGHRTFLRKGSGGRGQETVSEVRSMAAVPNAAVGRADVAAAPSGALPTERST
jgi:hypothetical protein